MKTMSYYVNKSSIGHARLNQQQKKNKKTNFAGPFKNNVRKEKNERPLQSVFALDVSAKENILDTKLY